MLGKRISEVLEKLPCIGTILLTCHSKLPVNAVEKM